MAKKRTAQKPKKSFEENLMALENIVQALESGELPLEESIQRYESGMVALKECYVILNDAEKKIETITKGKADGRRKKSTPEDTDDELLAAEDSSLF